MENPEWTLLPKDRMNLDELVVAGLMLDADDGSLVTVHLGDRWSLPMSPHLAKRLSVGQRIQVIIRLIPHPQDRPRSAGAAVDTAATGTSTETTSGNAESAAKNV